ncbi:MAG: hypothetical protein IJK27_02535 [Bacilli bacterium]|nr:hypothetical protein [Bacilli bacterium]
MLFKTGLKNYFKSMKHYFVPLGIFALFVIFSLTTAIPMMVNAVKVLFNECGKIVSKGQFDWLEIFSELSDQVAAVDWSDFNKGVATVSSRTWLYDTLTKVLSTVFKEEDIVKTFGDLIQNCIGTIYAAFAIIIAFFFIGIFVGFFVIKILVRKTVTRKNILKVILFSLVDAIIVTGLLVIFSLFNRLPTWANILLSIIFFLMVGFFTLFEAYLFYGLKKIKLKEVVNFKDLVLLYVTDLVILVIGVLICVALFFIFNLIFALFVILPIAEITISILGVNAEGYVVRKVEEKQEVKQLKPAKK